MPVFLEARLPNVRTALTACAAALALLCCQQAHAGIISQGPFTLDLGTLSSRDMNGISFELSETGLTARETSLIELSLGPWVSAPIVINDATLALRDGAVGGTFSLFGTLTFNEAPLSVVIAEPAGLLVMAAGLAGLAMVRRRR